MKTKILLRQCQVKENEVKYNYSFTTDLETYFLFYVYFILVVMAQEKMCS